MKFTKLNDDSSWLWEINGLHVLVDPWFTQSQVDFHHLFSTQFHLNQQPRIADLPRIDFVFISHPFTDHCNRETLEQLDAQIPVICLPNVQRKMKPWKHFQTFLSLSESPFYIEKISKSNFLDLVHHAYFISDGIKTCCYAPHGCKKILNDKAAAVLITTTTSYQLPFFLGGTVNLGLSSALSLAQKLQAQTILSTHDEQKTQRGIVARLSKRSFDHSEEIHRLIPGETFTI